MYKSNQAKTKASAADIQEAKARAQEWREFRRTYLYSQGHLATALRCCKRTIASVESGKETVRPNVELLRRFRSLKQKAEYSEYTRRQALGQHDVQADRSAVA